MNNRTQIIKYILADFLASLFAWALFFIYRKLYIDSPKFGFRVPLELGQSFLLGLIFIPFFWIFLHYASGFYYNAYHRARLHEFFNTFIITLIGVIILFFTLLLDDNITTYKNYYQSFFTLCGLQFILTYIPRLIFTSITNHKIRTGELWFNTLIIGNGKKAAKLYESFCKLKEFSGNRFIGFVNVTADFDNDFYNKIPHLGKFENVASIIDKYDIKEVIVAVETEEHTDLERIITKLQLRQVVIKLMPNLYDILTGSVRMSDPHGIPLLEIPHMIIAGWQISVKRIMDITISFIALMLLFPFWFLLAVLIKLDSKGPVFYSHERIGKNGVPFNIFKFRSMIQDAEANGPELSSEDDPRITRVGRFLRRTKLDETPQFINVIRGEMSLVGPRPERQFYIDQIVEKAPQYAHLLKIRPGITSWGQIKYGYANNVDQMVQRLRFDLIYLENMSILADIVILFYTAIAIIKGDKI